MRTSERIHEVLSDCAHVALFYLFRVFPIKKNKVMFSSFWGKGYGDNPKAICEALHQSGRSYELVWDREEDATRFPDYVRSVRLGSVQWIYEMATARVWIDNCRKPPYVRKRRKQYYIQTWHGDVCIKAVEADAADTLTPRYIRSAKNDSKMASVITSGCRWRTENIRKAFWYTGDILQAELYKPAILNETEYLQLESSIKGTMDVEPETKIALYAPTFRKGYGIEAYNLDYEALAEQLVKSFGGKWCVIVRLHPNISSLQNKIAYSDAVKNGSVFPDISQLMTVSDLVITDYSGIIFEALRRNKPLFLYGPDYEEYIREDRRLYFDLENMPASFSRSNQELHEKIQAFDIEEYRQKAEKFVQTLGYYDDDGIQVICDYIKKVTEESV